MDRTRTIRFAASIAALAAAGLYALIGAGVIYIGESTNGQDPGLAGFGAVMAVTFVAVALALLRFKSRAVWLAVAVVQLVTLVGYVAASEIRAPSFEAWGLLIKALQVVVLAGVGYLLLVRSSEVAR
jgi:hypothetical protein